MKKATGIRRREFMKEDKCCGTCKYHRFNKNDDEWVCLCPDSYYFGDYTEYDDKCEDWEGKK
ncbi:MAG: hypothetical protein LUD72_14025 [Bacteroidales bacterium]|nr:hypothetical protein [Bacteroidales bacterium]